MIPLSPVDNWIRAETGAETPEALLAWQLAALRDQLAYARRGAFQRGQLAGLDAASLRSLDDWERVPLCSCADLAADPFAFACVPQSRIERITTVFTSGSTGAPKRVFFSENDLETIVRFFRVGMSCLADASDTVLILMPSAIPWSIGDFLKRGLERLGAEFIEHGPVTDYGAALERARGATCLVGIPSQVYRMAKLDPALRPRTVLLSADYVPRAVVRLIERNWHTEVFVHYGLTESGLAGGVECRAHAGCHMRDADMLWEVVDAATGRRVPDGETGELVFSTLNREAMPLLRYRTGDLAVRLAEPCPCGSPFARIGRFQGRAASRAQRVSVHELDEELFSREGVLDYTAEWQGDELLLHVLGDAGDAPFPFSCPVRVVSGDGFFTRGTLKRRIGGT